MEALVSEFDLQTHTDKTRFLKDFFGEKGSWQYDLKNGLEYVFNLKTGDDLRVNEFILRNIRYSIDSNEQPYDEYRVFLAEQGGVQVGFLIIGLHEPKDNSPGISDSNLEVLIKGQGVGGRLEALKQYILQGKANELGDISDIGDDENDIYIKRRMVDVEYKYGRGRDPQKYRAEIEDLFRQRQQWLSLYGRGGRAGYEHFGKNYRGDSIFSKTFRKGESLPELRCGVEKNKRDFKKEIARL